MRRMLFLDILRPNGLQPHVDLEVVIGRIDDPVREIDRRSRRCGEADEPASVSVKPVRRPCGASRNQLGVARFWAKSWAGTHRPTVLELGAYDTTVVDLTQELGPAARPGVSV